MICDPRTALTVCTKPVAKPTATAPRFIAIPNILQVSVMRGSIRSVIVSLSDVHAAAVISIEGKGPVRCDQEVAGGAAAGDEGRR